MAHSGEDGRAAGGAADAGRMRAQEKQRSDLAVAASVAVVQRDAAKKWAGDATLRLFEVDA